MIDKEQEIPFFCKHLPQGVLGLIMLVLFVPAVYFGVGLGDMLFIIWRYGMKAYSEGLRFKNSKLGILNNGEDLETGIDICRGVFDFFLVLLIMVIAISLCDLIFSLYLKKKKDAPSVNI